MPSMYERRSSLNDSYSAEPIPPDETPVAGGSNG